MEGAAIHCETYPSHLVKEKVDCAQVGSGSKRKFVLLRWLEVLVTIVSCI